MTVELDARQRATLASLADVLIPGGEGMPSARDVGVAGELIDRAIAVRPNGAVLLPGILDVLDREDGPPLERLRGLREREPDAFTTLSSFVVGAYFLDERVRASIGYPGQGPRDATFADETGYIADGLLDPVLERGSRAPSA